MMTQENIKNENSAFSKFDLNLLRVFEAVYNTGSVKDAALELNCSASSISQSLNKLRDYFADPLFVREGSNLSCTVTAVNLYNSIDANFRLLIDGIDTITNKMTKNRLVVYCTPYLATIVLPLICLFIEKEKINCKVVHQYHDPKSDSASELLALRKVDLVFDIDPIYDSSIYSETLFYEQRCLVCRKDHPRIKETANIEELHQESFSIFDSSASSVKRAQSELAKLFEQRKFALRTSSILAMAAVAESTDLVAVITERFYQQIHSSFNIKKIKTNITFTPNPIYMSYKKVNMQDEISQKIIDHIHSVFPLTAENKR